jgi:hypothetical protein
VRPELRREDRFHSHDTVAVDAHFAGRPVQLRAAFDELSASLPGDELSRWLRVAYELRADAPTQG